MTDDLSSRRATPSLLNQPQLAKCQVNAEASPTFKSF
jgi:hypothetical protein